MAFALDTVVPWGRNLDEYRAMFALSDADLRGAILGCGDGPASFNAEMRQQGYRVVSVDPLYQFSVEQIRGRIAITRQQVMDQVRRNLDGFVWQAIPSPEALERIRLDAMRVFLDDFEQGQAEGRYLTGELPVLNCADQAFDLALCSHFLFLYSEQLTLDFHRQSIQELCRVAREVRIFPLQNLAAQPSPYVPALVDEFTDAGYTVTIQQVNYEFQRGGHSMLRITRGAHVPFA
jgi:hypothetical protein